MAIQENKSLKLPLVKFIHAYADSIIAQTSTAQLFTMHSLLDVLVSTPLNLLLIESFNPRASFKLRVLLFAVVEFLTSPAASMIWPNLFTLSLAFYCLIACINLLCLQCPLLASMPFILACNLDISCIFLLPIFLTFAIRSIITNSPSQYLVKQVDYIVWRAIILALNFCLLNMVIWWEFLIPQKKDGQTIAETPDEQILSSS